MEYERIHKVQSGIVSPSKLRLKLIGLHHHNRKNDGSNGNSARTSPYKLNDSEFVKNSLLASKNGDSGDEVPTLEVAFDKGAGEQISFRPKETLLTRENTDVDQAELQQFSQGDSGNMSSIHPMRMLEDENLDSDSNASSSSFEFHKGERSMQNHRARSFSRPMPSKWNDAEKWIMNRQIVQANYSKKNASDHQAIRLPPTNMVRVVPEYASHSYKPSVVQAADNKRVDSCQTALHTLEKFSFGHSGTRQAHGSNELIDLCTQSKDLEEVDQNLHCTKGSSENSSVVPAIRSVCMRDMGTEMTPGTSKEPSRTSTPVGATTPLRSPTSSIPSTPKGRVPSSTPMDQTREDELQNPEENIKGDLSEQEIKEKTRREIVALGVHLGKTSIAAWASKEDDDQGKKRTSVDNADVELLARMEFERHAAAWEEAEKSKHIARFKGEEIKIQAWESRQKSKLEAEMRRIEAEVEQMRAQAQAKMVKKMAMARQRSEEKRVAAEARKNQDAEKTSAQAEYIRQTGRMPSSSHFTCCGGWLSS